MSGKSSIEWCDATWNPVTGCGKVSPGCDNCYAERFAERWRGITVKKDGVMVAHPYFNGFDLVLRPERLEDPLRWKKPRRIFVNSMSDLFHRDVPDEFIGRVFAHMAFSNLHTFQVLTKRPERMRRLIRQLGDGRDLGKVLSLPTRVDRDRIIGRAELNGPPRQTFTIGHSWPAPNVWLGVSVESAAYKWRIDMLRETPAAVRFLSIEPLLGDVGDLNLEGIHWVIVGGESGPSARPMHPAWARSVRDQCVAAGVPFFFKQWGEWSADVLLSSRSEKLVFDRVHGDYFMRRVGKKNAGRELDGQEWNEFPKVVA